jgi:hypothetical protein
MHARVSVLKIDADRARIFDRILEANPDCSVVAATAGLMIRKDTVRRKRAVLSRSHR